MPNYFSMLVKSSWLNVLLYLLLYFRYAHFCVLIQISQTDLLITTAILTIKNLTHLKEHKASNGNVTVNRNISDKLLLLAEMYMGICTYTHI